MFVGMLGVNALFTFHHRGLRERQRPDVYTHACADVQVAWSESMQELLMNKCRIILSTINQIDVLYDHCLISEELNSPSETHWHIYLMPFFVFAVA